jgi:hypothetical protein
MIEYIVILGLILGTGYWIIRPLLRPSRYDRTLVPKKDETLKQLEVQKEGAYSAIRELEFDLKMGKLSSEDFEALKNQYTQEAVNYLKEIDKLQTNNPTNSSLSAEDIEAEIEREVVVLSTKKRKKVDHMYCTQCGSKASRKARFCFSCGAELIKPQLRLSPT